MNHDLANDRSTAHPATPVSSRPHIHRVNSLLNVQLPQDPRATFLKDNFCDLAWLGHDNPICAKHAKQAICEDCRSSPTYTQIKKHSSERGGVRGCDIRSVCYKCWRADHNIDEDGHVVWEDTAKEWAAHYTLDQTQRQRLAIMLDYVRAQPVREKVPITYFINIASFYKNWSTTYIRRDLIRYLSDHLRIEKVKNKYVCSKQGVDAMDFDLWYSRWNLARWRAP